MIWADSNGERVKATPKSGALCPCCKTPVIAKCGEIKAWHWAHESADCDPWYEPESEWHIGWKSKFPPEWQEVVMGAHRADIKTPTHVVELQNSSISSEDISAREQHYGNMVWLINGREFISHFGFTDKKTHFSFRWYHPRWSWSVSQKPLYIEFNVDRIFRVNKLYWGGNVAGWGDFVTEDTFLKIVGHDTPPATT